MPPTRDPKTMASMATTEHKHRSSSHTESESEFPTVTMDYRTVAEIDDAGSVITVDSSVCAVGILILITRYPRVISVLTFATIFTDFDAVLSTA
jgi:hypothetical protein